MLKEYQILDTQQCKTIMTLSDPKGKQIIRATIYKCFLKKGTTFIMSQSFWWTTLSLNPC
jgi:hypothetical protein